MNVKTEWPYEDIVNLPHHVSTTRPQMPMDKRAAQFAPFAALSGYDEAVDEAGRLTEEMVSLPDEVMDELSRKIAGAMKQKAVVAITFFAPDEKKDGGRYVEAAGKVKKAEMGQVILDHGLVIRMDLIVDVQMQDSGSGCPE